MIQSNLKNVRKSYPYAHVTINKNRVKLEKTLADSIHGTTGGSIYFSDGQEYEIELYNPLSVNVKACITIDGKIVSGGGIVIKNGERVYLERFIDNNHKFKFKTYSVDKTEEVEKAIGNNGVIEVKFYEEYVIPHYTYYTHTNFQQWPTNPFYKDLKTNQDIYLTTNTTSFNNNVEIKNLNSYIIGDQQETGKTELGSISNQEFSDYNGIFESNELIKFDFKIYPISKKELNSGDLKFRKYCTECGKKLKNTYKFCPSCGTKSE